MSFHNLFADGQSDAGAGIFLPVVKPLEDDEDALGVFRGNANAVVPYGESLPPCRRQGTGAPEIPLSWRLGMLYWAPYCLREAPHRGTEAGDAGVVFHPSDCSGFRLHQPMRARNPIDTEQI